MRSLIRFRAPHILPRMRRSRCTRLGWLLPLLTISLCQTALAADDHATHSHDERPLPAFSGTLIDGKPAAISDFIGKRLAIFFFNPEVADAEFVATAVGNIAKFRASNNFTIVGVAMGSDLATVRVFKRKMDLDFPIFNDSSGRISGRLGIRQPLGIYGVDAEGYLDWGIGYFVADADDPAAIVEQQLREHLRLPSLDATQVGVLDLRPTAPHFKTGGFDLADYEGKPVVLVFFLHTCPHCHAALKFFKEQLARIPENKRPELIGISAQNRPSTVRDALKKEGIDYFEVAYDPTNEIMQKYGVFAGFPDVILIDREGKIVHRTQGWRADRDPALNRMYLAKIAGERVPMLLNPRGYTGSDVCAVCHELESQSYQFTQHATAFSTLVKHGDSRDGECVSCHVVGFDKPGGYTFKESPEHLENVGCESCHGRGGPHLTPGFVSNDAYAEVCQTCHNPTHSLGFDYATFRPRISHTTIAALSDAERAQLVADGARPRDVLPKTADYVGSNACQACHAGEFKTWESGPHAHAVQSLAKDGKTNDSTCLACHTTAMGRPGGFPEKGKGSDSVHADLARVGCESCHGPGGDHIKPESMKIGSIVSLADKCDSCVILQICGSCHDEANDPGFEFNVDEKIERQRHGTIEAGTGKPLSKTSLLDPRSRSLAEDLSHAFALADNTR